MTLTPEQQFVQQHPGSVSVDAGAGSGKTFTLTRRLLRLLQGGLRAEQLVAVTFSEPAAAELRERLQALLDREVAAGHAELAEAAATLPLAQISTIHALCARVLRDHPVESGAGLRFEVLDEAGAAALLEQALPQILGELPPEDFGELPVQLALDAVALMLREPFLAQEALQVSLERHGEALAQLDAQIAQQAAASEQQWNECLEVLGRHACPVPGDPLEQARQRALAAAHVQGSAATRRAAMRSALDGVRSNAGSAAVWGKGPDKAEVLGVVNLLKVLATPDSRLEQARWQQTAVPVLDRLYRHVRSRLDELAGRTEQFTFADLERLAAHALASEHVRAHYAGRWRAVFVDEFQDTSPLQWQILRAISGVGVNLTVVGDEKQSIYAFRGSDVRIFRGAREQIVSGGGGAGALSVSFRTHRALVDVMNGFFRRFMAGPTGEASTAATFTPLSAHRPAPASPAPTCEIHTIGGPVMKPALRQAEANLIAHRIQSLVAEGRTVQEGDGVRPLRYGDVAVLMRARTHLSTYEEALFRAGIPYAVQGGRGLLERPEVQDLTQLLSFLARPSDDLALAAVLRSPLFGWSDERLLNARGAGGFWAALLAAGDAPPLLTRLLEARISCGASALVTLALEASDHAAVMASLPDGARRLANIDAFLALLHGLGARGQGTVHLAVKALQDELRLELPVPEARLSSGDTVQVMTIHGSKGLEFPVVIVTDLLGRAPADSAPLLMDAALGLALRVPDTVPAEQPAPFRALRDLQQERQEAEHERLLYVAMTRAADTLILTLGAKASELPAARALTDLFPEEHVARFSYAPGSVPVPQAGRIARNGQVHQGVAATDLAVPETLPVTSLATYLSCPQAFAFRHVLGRPPFTALWDAEAQVREGGVSGALVGSAVHEATELGLSEAGILAGFPHLPLAERQEVARLCGRLNGEPYRTLAGHTPRREVPVSVRVGALTFEGVIDAIYDDLDLIVDYKTDRQMQPTHHAPQLALYLAATGLHRASLAYLRHDQLYTLTTAELQAADDSVKLAAQRISGLDFTPDPAAEKCRWCSFQQGCSASTR